MLVLTWWLAMVLVIVSEFLKQCEEASARLSECSGPEDSGAFAPTAVNLVVMRLEDLWTYPEAAEAGCKLLRDVLVFERRIGTSSSAIAQAGGIRLVFSCLQRYPASSPVVENSFFILRHLVPGTRFDEVGSFNAIIAGMLKQKPGGTEILRWELAEVRH